MALVINTNVASLNAQRNLAGVQSQLTTALQRLSSGLRVNSAKDDAAGMYTIEQQTAAIRGLNQAVRNAADGTSLGQTAEGAMAQIANNLQRIREIAVQSANGTVQDRTGLQAETDQLTQEISRIVQTTQYNGTALLSASTSITFQLGYSGATSNQISVSTAVLTGITGYSGNLTATGVIDVSSASAASAALASVDTAINTVSQSRATFGAVQNRFDAVVSNLQNYVENLTAARSRIQDTDFAMETSNLTRAQILQQSAVAMVAQANVIPQAALALLK
jgi:flagellin